MLFKIRKQKIDETELAPLFSHYYTTVNEEALLIDFLLSNETLYNYEMDDNLGGWTGMKVPWKRLVETLASRLPILFGNPVTRITPVDHCGFLVYTGNDKVYATKNVIIATKDGVTKEILSVNPDITYIHKR